MMNFDMNELCSKHNDDIFYVNFCFHSLDTRKKQKMNYY